MRELKQEQFDEIINNSEKPVLVDFFATWCGPCKAMHPILESVEESETGLKYDFYQVDVDQAPELSQRFGIMAVPTLAIFKDGNLLYKQAGVHQAPQLEQLLKDHL